MEMITNEIVAGAAPADARNQVPGGAGIPSRDMEMEENKRMAADALKALEVARTALAEESARTSAEAGEDHASVDVSSGIAGDHQLAASESASENDAGRAASMDVPSADGASVVSEITEDDKSAFIESLVTGGRYRREVSILGGRIVVGMRSRTVGESEAIDSYIRRKVADGTIKVGIEYSDAMRLCLCVFTVERVGEETFPEMASPLMAVSTPDGVKEPEWTRYLDLWRAKPEGLVNAILPEVFKFETKYNEMVRHGADENFWRTGGSTGE